MLELRSYTSARAVLTPGPPGAPETAPQAEPRTAVLVSDPSTLPSATAEGDVAPQRQRSLARAARHDILRRLAPPLRHDMVVPLQALGMVAEALNARMERGNADLDAVQDSISKLTRLARQAMTTCADVCTWMQPAENDAVGLREGVAESVRLLSTSLSFRGFELRSEAAEGELEVSRFALRFLLPAVIFALVDAAPAPGEIVLRIESSATHGVVAVEYQPLPEGSAFTQLHEPGGEPLSWLEVQALAADEGAQLQRSGSTIVLRLPRALVTTPLAMAPV